MPTIDQEGFLSHEITRFTKEIRRRYRPWFALVEDINRASQTLLTRLEVHPEVARETMTALFFERVLSHSQGAVVMIEHGMRSQAEVLCRCALEALFTLGAISREASSTEDLILEDRRRRLELFRASERLEKREAGGAPTPADAAERARLVAELEQALQENPRPRLSTKVLAERAGLGDLYDSAYSLLSLTVHSNLRDVERQLALDSEGRPQSIGWGPDGRDLDALLMTVAECLLRACVSVSEVFEIESHETIDPLNRRFAKQSGPLLGRT